METASKYEILPRKGNSRRYSDKSWGTAEIAGSRVTFTCKNNGKTYRATRPREAAELLKRHGGMPLGWVIQQTPLVEE